ncbi:hypothetical protein ACFQU1_10875 [Chelatococcus sp. GCM10030263]|uniref:hypothetical protein n=1 Tax=Chelatococcus sp. GCM10030263 TaxID=3273387 RepID=UPI0036075085
MAELPDPNNFQSRIMRELLTSLCVVALILLCAAGPFLATPDDIGPAYSGEAAVWLIGGNAANYRYAVSVVNYVVSRFGYDYFSTAGFWIIAFPLSVWFCSDQIVRYARLPPSLVPWMTLLVGLHGYFSELYPFTMGYINYAIALGGSGLAIFAARRLSDRPLRSVAAIGGAGWIALVSYQPFALTLLFAAALALVHDQLTFEKSPRSIRNLAPLVAGFLLACVLFLLSTRLATVMGLPSSGRAGTVSSVSANLGPYALDIIHPFWNGVVPYRITFPLHERIIYAAAQIGILGALIWRILKQPRNADAWWATLAFAAAVAVTPNPMNLTTATYWPTLRSMSQSAFWQVGCLLIAWTALKQLVRIQAAPRWFAVAFVCLSAANQISLLHERFRQAEQDEVIARAIVDDLRRIGALHQGVKIAIVSDWRSVAQLHRAQYMDMNLSAFSTEWSNANILRRASGLDLQLVRVDKTLCDGASGPWEVRKRDDIILVCMPPQH